MGNAKAPLLQLLIGKWTIWHLIGHGMSCISLWQALQYRIEVGQDFINLGLMVQYCHVFHYVIAIASQPFWPLAAFYAVFPKENCMQAVLVTERHALQASCGHLPGQVVYGCWMSGQGPSFQMSTTISSPWRLYHSQIALYLYYPLFLIILFFLFLFLP